jgi:hypothetical protein
MNRIIFLIPLVLATGLALADDVPAAKRAPAAEAPAEKERKEPTKEGGNLGMSILGNQEAPKSLVIVPWKSSELGGSLGVAPMLDDSKRPVDKEVFMRALSYYEIRSGKKP